VNAGRMNQARLVFATGKSCPEHVRLGARRVSSKRAAARFERGLTGKSAQGARRNHGDPGRRGGPGNESGAVLILALAYIVAISLIVGALADWAMNDLNNTTKFNSTSQLHVAVSSITDLAIQNIRYAPDPTNPNPSPNPTPLGTCWVPVTGPNVSQYAIDNYTVAVWCSTLMAFASDQTRTVTFYACLSSLTSSSSPGAITSASVNCQASPMLKAVVVFDDYPAQGAPGQTLQCNIGLGQCGEGWKLQSWTWGAAS